MTAIASADRHQRSLAKFWDRIAESYSRKPVADEQAYQRKLRMTRDYLRPDMQVFEFGCGTGSTALVHAPFVSRVLATDVSSRMIEIARNKAETDGVANVEFQQVSFDEFQAPEQSFDVVLGLSILHLVEDRDTAIAKVHRLLKPGGVFVSSTACLGDGMSYFKAIAPVGRFFGLLPLLRVFTADDLADNLVRRGFEIEHRWRPGKRQGVFIVAKKVR